MKGKGKMNGKMNEKMKATLLIAVFLLSALAIVTQPTVGAIANPGLANAILESGGGGSSAWTAAEKHTGSYSVALVQPTADAYAEIQVPVNIKLNALDMTKTSFWRKTGTAQMPYFIFRFADGTSVNTDGAGAVSPSWAQYTASSTPQWQYTNGTWHSWADTLTAYGDRTVTTVLVELSGLDASLTAYVDDIQINGVTYGLEPIILNAEYYRTGDTVTVTVANGSANLDPLRSDTVNVDVISNSDTVGIDVELTETGVNTGIFTGTFPLVATTPEPGVDELGVDDGDTITATYLSNIAEAIVDDSPPTITDLTPDDESLVNYADPVISATLADDGSGINVDSVVMTVDGVDVTADATVTDSSVTYTPGTDLTDGNHTVTVDASDNLGNEATTASWSFIVDTTHPTVAVDVDKDPANASEVTFTLTFSENMDNDTEPTVTFATGVDNYTITGGWDTSDTEWVGTYFVDGDTGDGVATINVTAAVDPAGNVMEEDTSNTFVIDTLAPDAPDADDLVVSMNAPGVNDTIAGIEDAVEANATVNVYSDDGLTLLIGSATADEDGSFPAISIGDNTNAEVWVTATDAAGNEGTATSMPNDIEEPEIASVTWTSVNEDVRTDENITVTLVGEAGCVATFDIGDIALNQTMTETEAGTYVGNYTVVPGNDGEWTVTGNLTDEAGNTDSLGAADSVTIITDEVDPVIESTDVTYPIGVYSARVNDTFVVEAVVTDEGTGVETVTAGSIGMELVDDTWTVDLYYNDTDPGTYNLTITATDFAGNTANTTVTVVVTTSLTGYNVELDEGWNLVSLPLIPDNSSIVAVLGEADAVTEVVWSYDAEATTWYMYNSSAPEASDLSTMVDGKGYWIKTNDTTTLVIDGIEEPLPPQTPPSYAVVEGWNLIGFKETYDMTENIYLHGIEGKYVRMYTYEDGAFKRIAPGETMEPGEGYWLAVTGEGYIYP